jgi:hypothetical protein
LWGRRSWEVFIRGCASLKTGIKQEQQHTDGKTAKIVQTKIAVKREMPQGNPTPD